MGGSVFLESSTSGGNSPHRSESTGACVSSPRPPGRCGGGGRTVLARSRARPRGRRSSSAHSRRRSRRTEARISYCGQRQPYRAVPPLPRCARPLGSSLHRWIGGGGLRGRDLRLLGARSIYPERRPITPPPSAGCKGSDRRTRVEGRRDWRLVHRRNCCANIFGNVRRSCQPRGVARDDATGEARQDGGVTLL